MKYLHTMVRISNIAESLRFYCDGLGLEEVRRTECQIASNNDPHFASNRDPSVVRDLLSTRWFGATIRMRLGGGPAA